MADGWRRTEHVRDIPTHEARPWSVCVLSARDVTTNIDDRLRSERTALLQFGESIRKWPLSIQILHPDCWYILLDQLFFKITILIAFLLLTVSSPLNWFPFCRIDLIWLLFLVSYTVCTHVGGPKILGMLRPAPLKWGGGWPLETVSPHHAKFGNSRSNRTRVIMEIRQKSLTSRVQSFKVTRCHWNWHGSIGHLWLPISDPTPSNQ